MASGPTTSHPSATSPRSFTGTTWSSGRRRARRLHRLLISAKFMGGPAPRPADPPMWYAQVRAAAPSRARRACHLTPFPLRKGGRGLGMSVQPTTIAESVRRQAERGKAASRQVALLSAADKNAALAAMAAALRGNAEMILAANAADVQRAREAQMAPYFIDRLSLDTQRLDEMARGIQA